MSLLGGRYAKLVNRRLAAPTAENIKVAHGLAVPGGAGLVEERLPVDENLQVPVLDPDAERVRVPAEFARRGPQRLLGLALVARQGHAAVKSAPDVQVETLAPKAEAVTALPRRDPRAQVEVLGQAVEAKSMFALPSEALV